MCGILCLAGCCQQTLNRQQDFCSTTCFKDSSGSQVDAMWLVTKRFISRSSAPCQDTPSCMAYWQTVHDLCLVCFSFLPTGHLRDALGNVVNLNAMHQGLLRSQKKGSEKSCSPSSSSPLVDCHRISFSTLVQNDKNRIKDHHQAKSQLMPIPLLECLKACTFVIARACPSRSHHGHFLVHAWGFRYFRSTLALFEAIVYRFSTSPWKPCFN